MKQLTRRDMLRTGAAVMAATSLRTEAFAAPKQPGELRALFLMGDYWHNPISQEMNWRGVLAPTGWRLMFSASPAVLTPDVLNNVDLLGISMYNDPITVGFSPDRIVENRPDPAPYLTDAQTDILIERVRAGMGFLSIHATIMNEQNRRFMDLIGLNAPKMHTPVQPAHIHKLNTSHPITRGMEAFDLGDDEIFYADVKTGEAELLFNTSGQEVPVDQPGGWCRTEGKGRVVALLPGHMPHLYHRAPYKSIMWRAAHWAAGLEIPSRTFEEGQP